MHTPAQDRTMRQDALYRDAAAAYDGALKRLARAYERDAALREELLQDIHLALWQSFAGFDGRCSLRTWIYRVAHNVASTHILRRRPGRAVFLTLDDVPELPDTAEHDSTGDARQAVQRLLALIERLKPVERQVILLYLEGFEAAEIAEVVGTSASAVVTRIHRIKQILKRRFGKGAGHE